MSLEPYYKTSLLLTCESAVQCLSPIYPPICPDRVGCGVLSITVYVWVQSCHQGASLSFNAWIVEKRPSLSGNSGCGLERLREVHIELYTLNIPQGVKKMQGKQKDLCYKLGDLQVERLTLCQEWIWRCDCCWTERVLLFNRIYRTGYCQVFKTKNFHIALALPPELFSFLF